MDDDLPLETFNSRSDIEIDVDFTDLNGAAVTPTSVLYRIDDDKTGTEIKATTTVTPSGSTVTIPITKSEMAMITAGESREIHVLTVRAIYGASQGMDSELKFWVKNVRNSSKF